MREDGALMRHELAYILGQMRNRDACPFLTSILEDESDDILVRHESAEALGAIGHSSSIAVLEKYSKHPASEISETCQIALELINWKVQQEALEESKGNHCTNQRGLYLSVDPAPPLTEALSIADLQKNLLDPSLSLFHRYRAMFSLRDANSDSSALALVSGFDDKSALFRHEIAFVLGQMQRIVTIPGLADILKNKGEHRMVNKFLTHDFKHLTFEIKHLDIYPHLRSNILSSSQVRHEAAEALGAIGGVKAEKILSLYLDDDERVITESCEVALDAMDYWANEFC